MNDETLLQVKLAYAIGEWDTAMDHLDALEAVQVAVSPITWGRLSRELNDLCTQYAVITGRTYFHPDDRGEVVAEARAFATRYLSEIEDLTQRQGSET